MAEAQANADVSVQPAEKIFVALLLVALFVIPPVFTELFPLSVVPIYADPHFEVRLFRLFDAKQDELPMITYGLSQDFSWYISDHYGVRWPINVVNPTDSSPDWDRIIAHVRKVGTQTKASFPLTLECRLYGAIDDQHVGLKDTKVVTISADHD